MTMTDVAEDVVNPTSPQHLPQQADQACWFKVAAYIQLLIAVEMRPCGCSINTIS